MQNKRGQFYIIAAIIIIIIITGLVGLGTYVSVNPSPKTIQSLSADLKKESPEIVDYGIYNERDLSTLLTEFTGREFAPYFLQKTDNANIVFIYGNKTNLKAVKYNTLSTGSITASIGGSIVWENYGPFAEKLNITSVGEYLVVRMFDRDYKFKIHTGEIFYFVIISEKEGETYVERN